jgi:hypothetical protein
MAGKRISHLAAPVDADDAASKQYVDSRAGKPSAAPTISKNITMKGHWISGDGDSEGIYVADSGNVGIGTAFPDSRLSVRGDISITDDTASILRIGRYGPDYPFSYVTAGDTATQIRFQIAQVTKMTINSDGNVGIGTTEPNAPLEVKGNIISDPPSEGTHVATKAYVDTRTASGPVTMITAREAASDLKGAVAYCRALTAACEHVIDGTCDKTEYSDWRLPTAEEIVLFVGIADDAGKLWSRTPFQSNPGHTILMDLKSGGWIAGDATGAESAGVRCVR